MMGVAADAVVEEENGFSFTATFAQVLVVPWPLHDFQLLG
jgi:hypothetical protein